MVNGKDVYPKGELPYPKTDIQYTSQCQCLFFGFLQNTSQHVSTPPLSIKDFFAECADTLPK